MTSHHVLHWFDFICPFCYIAQDRNRILREAAVSVIDLPMQIHPEIGPGGAPAPPRAGPMYDYLVEEARAAGRERNWAPRMPYSRVARGQDIEDWTVIAQCAEDVGVEPFAFQYSITSGIADNELRFAEEQASKHHVLATPSWVVKNDQLIAGLRPRAFFIALSRTLSCAHHREDPSPDR